MSEHTPGPWIAVRGCAYWEVKPQRKGGERKPPYQIADTCSSDPGNPDKGLQEANARLIAAAPDLLAGLEQAIWMLYASGVPPKKPAMESFEATIRKARGME